MNFLCKKDFDDRRKNANLLTIKALFMRFFLLTIGLIFYLTAGAQSEVDSLAQLAEKAASNEKAAIYLRIVKSHLKDSALSGPFSRKAYQLAVANQQTAEQARSVYYSGRISLAARDFHKAIRHFSSAIPLFAQVNDSVSMTTCWNYIGIANFSMSKSKEAIAAYLEALKLTQHDPDYSAELLANIGLVHDEMDNLDAAIDYYQQAVALNQAIRDSGSLAIDYDYLGAAYARLKRSDSAVINYQRALHLFSKTGKDDRYAVTLSNLATVLPHYPDSLEKAIEYFNLAWKKFQELGWNHYEVDISQGIGDVLLKEGKPGEAIGMYEKALQLAFKFKRELLIKRTIYRQLAEAYQAKGNYKRALENHVLFSQYNDSVNETQIFEQVASLEKQFETERKEIEINSLQAKQALTNLQLKKNREIKILGFALAIVLLALVFFILKRYADKARLNKLLESKNEAIEKSEKELQAINAAKNKFFTIIAHDLKNPFLAVMGYSELLCRDFDRFDEAEKRKFAGEIHSSANKIYQLLENLLKWSHAQTGRLTFKPSEVELKLPVSTALDLLQPQANKKNIRISLDFDENLVIFADPLMIETVIRNLLSNAIKFTDTNGHIEISGVRKGSWAEICVKDNGIGIPETELSKLFRIDSTVKQKGTADEDGSGLGLIICQEFVRKHEGEIRVSSAPEKGSMFCFTVPAAKQAQMGKAQEKALRTF